MTSARTRTNRFPIGGFTRPGRASFDWSIFFAALALLVPCTGLIGACFAEHSRRRGYPRWKSAMAMDIWCVLLGAFIRILLHVGVFP
jgi:hypothetical protein